MWNTMSSFKGSVRRQWVSQYDLPTDDDEASDSSGKRTRSSNFSALKNTKSKVLFTLLATFAFVVVNFSQDLTNYKTRGDISTFQSLRSLSKRSLTCGKKTPYISPIQATTMPNTQGALQESKSLPTHITLCQELLKRNEESQNDPTEEDKFHPKSKFLVQEDPIVCIDWTKPHSNIMQLIASSVVAYVGERFGLQYQHNCYGSIDNQLYDSLEFDVTTIQEIFPQIPMPIDQNVLGLGEIVHNLCKSCLNDFKQNHFPVKEATHQCLLFPEIMNVHNGYVRENADGSNEGSIAKLEVKEEVLDNQGHIVHTALEAVLPLVRNRLYHAALDWSDKARIPQFDPKSGVVIAIDSNLSLPIPFRLYQQYIPLTATHVSILARPDCAKGTLGSVDQAISCVQYGMELRQYLQGHYKDGVEVSFDLVSSTATAYSRMILSHALVCPPGTISCLFPALAKESSKEAIMFESSDRTSTYHWFTSLGKKAQNVKVVTLSQQEMAIDNEQLQVESQYKGFVLDEVTGHIPVESASNSQQDQVEQIIAHDKTLKNGVQPPISNQTNATKADYLNSETAIEINSDPPLTDLLSSSLNMNPESDPKLLAKSKSIGNVESEVSFVNELPDMKGAATEGERIDDEGKGEMKPLSQERSIDNTSNGPIKSEKAFIEKSNIDSSSATIGTTSSLAEVGTVLESQVTSTESSTEEVDFSSSANLFSNLSREESSGRFQGTSNEVVNDPIQAKSTGIDSTLSNPTSVERGEDSSNTHVGEVSMDYSSLFGGRSENKEGN